MNEYQNMLYVVTVCMNTTLYMFVYIFSLLCMSEYNMAICMYECMYGHSITCLVARNGA